MTTKTPSGLTADELRSKGREILGKEPEVVRFRLVTEAEELAQQERARKSFGFV